MERTTDIVLFGSRYTIKSHLTDSQIQDIILNVEKMILEVQSKSKSMSLHNACIVSCLQLASELEEIKSRLDIFKEETVLELLKAREMLNGKESEQGFGDSEFEGTVSSIMQKQVSN